MEDKEFFIDDYRISYVFNFPSPFIEKSLINVLKEKGFDISIEPRIINAPPFRAIRSDIAKKGDITVIYNDEVSYIGIAGNSFSDVKTNFLILDECLKTIDISTLNKKKHTEIFFRGRIWTHKDPQDTISKFMTSEKLDLFSENFGTKVRPFTVRIVTEKKEILDNPDFFSLRIEPLINNPRYYFIEFIYRNEDIKKVMKTIEEMEKIIYKSIDIIEAE